MRETLEIPVYETKRYKYIRISDLKEEYERRQLNEWIAGQLCPLIQGEGKGVPAILDAVFLFDYERFLKNKDLPLTDEEKYAIIKSF